MQEIYSVREGSFLENSKLSIKIALSITWLWASRTPTNSVVEITGMGKKNVIDWYDFFRVVCSRAIADTPESFQFGQTGAV